MVSEHIYSIYSWATRCEVRSCIVYIYYTLDAKKMSAGESECEIGATPRCEWRI